MKIVLHKTKVNSGNVVIGDISIIILSILVVVSEIPIIARNVPNTLFYGLIFLFVLSTLKVIVHLDNTRVKTVLLLLLYIFMIAVYKVIAISSADLSYYSTTIKYFFFLFAMLIIGGNLNEKQKDFLIATILLSMAYTVIDNIRLFIQYGASIYVHLFQWERFTTNSVNTTFVSSQLFLTGILLTVYLHTRKKGIKIATISLVVLNIAFIASIAQRMIVFGLAIIMIPLIILYNQRHSAKRVVVALLFIVIGLLVFANITSVIDLLDAYIKSDRLHLRFEQIKTFMATRQAGAAGGTLSARVSLYMRSINTWTSSVGNFVFGAGDHRITNEIIGNHSDFIDECARYGVVGMIVWIPLIIRYLKSILYCSGVNRNSTLYYQMRVIFLIFLANAMLSDVYEATVGIQMFILLPIVFSLIQERENNKNVFGKI